MHFTGRSRRISARPTIKWTRRKTSLVRQILLLFVIRKSCRVRSPPVTIQSLLPYHMKISKRTLRLYLVRGGRVTRFRDQPTVQDGFGGKIILQNWGYSFNRAGARFHHKWRFARQGRVSYKAFLGPNFQHLKLLVENGRHEKKPCFRTEVRALDEMKGNI